ncbi:MAG: SCO family protein [Oligoflexia bacterium]|nr:SCO family protein [Oligoflexia bacterium]
MTRFRSAVAWSFGVLLLGVLFLACLGGGVARAERTVPAKLEGITITEHLGAAVNPNLVLTDESGQKVRLGQFFGDGKPVLLTMNYYNCAMLCTIQLNGLVAGLKNLNWTPGDQFRILTVSIDPDDTPELAASKRKSYLDSYGRGDDVDWHFLVGEEDQVRALADSVGFAYRYDPEQDQYAHAAAIMLLAPDATVARYLYGIEYSARDLKFGLMEAAAGRVGSPAERLILSCFHYDETIGEYTPFAFGIMRLGGAVSIIVIVILGIVMWRQELSHKDGDPGADTTEIPS